MVASMGEMVQFDGPGGRPTEGYLAMASAPGAPGVVVIQEWWGLIDQIKGICDRLAAAGFSALAPDLYGGTVVPLEEPDDAAKEMMSLQLEAAAEDMSGAVELLRTRTGHDRVGVIGFCMGGGLALVLAARRPDAVSAVIPCYGVHPWEAAHPDYASMTAATQIHCAGLDDFFTPEAAEELVGTLGALGKEVELHVYPASQHAFFNEDRPEVYDPEASEHLWARSLDFLASHLSGR
jgi:carboxymethylenebutenolidase